MHPRSEIDQELVLRVAGGDPDALDEIYGRYARSVYGLAYRILGDASAAEDVVQEVFLKLWRQPSSYNAERGSLGVVARRLAPELQKHFLYDIFGRRCVPQYAISESVNGPRVSPVDFVQRIRVAACDTKH